MANDEANQFYNRVRRQLSEILVVPRGHVTPNENIHDPDDNLLNQYYNTVKHHLRHVKVVQGSQSPPSKKNLKIARIRHFNVNKLEEQYVRYNEANNVAIVDALQTTLDNIASELNSEQYGFDGEFKKVGSFKDGTKVRVVNEFDCLFVFNTRVYQQYDARPGNKPVTRQVFEGDARIIPHDFRTRFADAVNQIAETLTLGGGLEHGGFASPKFSGVRINKPTVTLLFEWTGRNEKRKLTVDLTPALPATKSDEETLLDVITKKIEPITEHIELFFDLRGKIHYVPLYDDEWYLTSTELEAYLLERIPEIPIKKCIKLGKITSVLHIEEENRPQMYLKKAMGSHEMKGYQNQIENSLDGYKRRGKRDRERRNVAKKLRYGHVLLTPDICAKYNETVKSPTSLVSAAIKYQTLTQACERFRKGTLTMNHSSEFSLLSDVFAAFGKMDSPKVPHFFLPDEVKIVSIAPYALYDAEEETFGTKCKCQKLAKRLTATRRFYGFVGYVKNKITFVLIIVAITFLFAIASNLWYYPSRPTSR